MSVRRSPCSQVRAFKTTKKALKTLGGAFGLHRVSRGERERRVRGLWSAFRAGRTGGLRRSAGCRCRGVRGLEGRAAAQGGRAPDENRCRRRRYCRRRCRCRVRGCCRSCRGGAVADVAATDSAPGHLPEERMRSPSEAESRPGMRYAEADFSLTAACRVAGALKRNSIWPRKRPWSA